MGLEGEDVGVAEGGHGGGLGHEHLLDLRAFLQGGGKGGHVELAREEASHARSYTSPTILCTILRWAE